MRTKKTFISAILITTVMLFLGGCGKQAESVSAKPTETVKEVDTEESMEGSEAPDNFENEAIVEDEAIIEDEVIVEDKVAAEETASTKTEAPKTDTGSSTTKTTTSGSTTTESTTVESKTTETTSGSTTNKPKTETTTENVQPAEPAPATPAPVEPAHTHSWIEHTATKQVWVANIVIVDDYEEQIVGKTPEIATCECGYVTDADSMFEHFKACNVSKGSTYYTTEGGQDIIEQVKVGSHEEDKGHYETKNYVDYYYCECGETKN